MFRSICPSAFRGVILVLLCPTSKMCSLAIMTFLAGWVLERVHVKALDKLRKKFWSGRTRELFRASRRTFAEEYKKTKPSLQAVWVGPGWALNRSLAKAFDFCFGFYF